MKQEKPKIGVYVCHCGMNIAPKVDVAAVSQFAQDLEHVEVARNYKFMCSNPGQELIIQDIREQGLNRVVVASCSPRMHEPTFRNACEMAGISPHCFQMANIREQSSWVTEESEKATAKAKNLVAAAASRVVHHRPLRTREVAVKKSVLIVGAGIAGMQAALVSAGTGFNVYLVEREPSIGGHMAKFDKTFPTLDCAACISTPKTVSIGQHPNINLYCNSEVVKVEGFVGNFTVTVRRKPRYVSEETCTGCGQCAGACPVEISSPFDEGLSFRRAAYRSFPQAVPPAFCIDKRDRAPCTRTCPAGLNVQGYIQLAKQGKYREAVQIIMKRIPLPGVLGRVCPSPCEAECRRAETDQPLAIRELKRLAADHVNLDDLPKPEIEEKEQKIAVIGSGPAGLTAAYDLRLMGYQVTIFESLSVLGGMLRVGIPDYRLPPDVLDREIDHILGHGIEVRTGISFGTDLTIQDLEKDAFSAVFFGIGAHKSIKLGIPGEEDTAGVLDALAFLQDVNLGSRRKPGDRVVVIGGGNVAVDAAGVAKRTGSETVTIVYRRSEKEMPAFSEEIEGVLEEGVELSCLTAPVRIFTENNKVAGLECVRTELGPQDESGRRRPIPVAGSEFVISCDAVVSAIGQKPKAPWANQLAELQWTRYGTLEIATQTGQTSLTHVFSGGDAVRGPATVIEAVADGHKAAVGINEYLQGNQKERVGAEESTDETPGDDWLGIPADCDFQPQEKTTRLNGKVRVTSFDEISRGLTAEQGIMEARRCLNCGGCCECGECVKACEASAINHAMKEETVEIEAGALILATGFNTFDPTPMAQYGYGVYPEVYTSLEFERLNNATGPTSGHLLMKNGQPPQRVAIVHCVGSRDSRHMKYCSRVCCMYSMKFAHLVREKTGAEVWEYYIDVRAPGKLYEEFYDRVQEEGVHFIRGRVAEVTCIPDSPADEGCLTVVAENTLTRRISRVAVDMVILSVGLEPADGSDEIGRLTGVSRDGDGWFTELHTKMAPVSTPINGVFLAGCCQGPKDIPDTVSQASGAAGEAVALLSKGTVRTLAEISGIDPDTCIGCRTCIEVCPYSAVQFSAGQGIAKVIEPLCQGCGSCAAACPSSAARIGHFSDKQIMGELEALLL